MVKKKIKVIWDIEAKRSLRSIYDYLKHKESIAVAKKVTSAIIKLTRGLNQFPEKFSEELYLKKGPGNFVSKLSGVTKLFTKSLQMPFSYWIFFTPVEIQ